MKHKNYDLPLKMKEPIEGGVPPSDIGAHVPESPELQLYRQELQDQLDRLCQYIIKSARHRIKGVKKKNTLAIQKALQGEVILSTAWGRMDLVENLLARGREISHIIGQIAQLEEEDYVNRFSSTSR